MTTPNFKDFANMDLAVFLNPDEHAEVHNIDGMDLSVVIVEDNTHERSRQPMDLYNASSGVYLGSITLYVAFSDLGYRPVTGQLIRIDGKMYPVSECSLETGMLKIVLEANEA